MTSSEHAGRSVTVLIVDDDRETRGIVEAYFGHHGHPIVATASAEEALAIARSKRPRAIVTELYLPAAEFRCLTQAIRADAALRHVPVIAYSAFGMPEDREWAQAAGVSAFLTKPALPSALLALIDDVLAAASKDDPRPHREQ